MPGGNISLQANYDLLIRDAYHGIGWYGVGKRWNGVDIDGPVLYGYNGDILSINQSGTRISALTWLANGNVGIGTTAPTVRLDVAGNIRCVVLAQTSGRRFRQNIRPLTSALSSVIALQGMHYEWNTLGCSTAAKPIPHRLASLRRNVEKIDPELVSTNTDGFKAVNCAQLISRAHRGH